MTLTSNPRSASANATSERSSACWRVIRVKEAVQKDNTPAVRHTPSYCGPLGGRCELGGVAGASTRASVAAVRGVAGGRRGVKQLAARANGFCVEQPGHWRDGCVPKLLACVGAGSGGCRTLAIERWLRPLRRFLARRRRLPPAGGSCLARAV